MVNRGKRAGEKAREIWWGGVEMGAGQVCGGCPHLPPVLHSGFGDGRAETQGDFIPCPPCILRPLSVLALVIALISPPSSLPHCTSPVALLSSSLTHWFPIFWNGYIYCLWRKQCIFLWPLGRYINRHMYIWISGAVAALLWCQLIGSSQTTSLCLMREPARRTFPLKP